jgi:hypothetical protein
MSENWTGISAQVNGHRATYQPTYMTCLLEVTEESRLEFAVAVVVCFVGLQNLVEPFEKECPEVVERAIVSHTFANVSRVMVIWFDHIGSIQLV